MLGCTVNAALTAPPSGFRTAIGPVVAPFGTKVSSRPLDTGSNVAGVPLNETEVVDFNAVPVIVTADPVGPADRESPVMLGTFAWAMPGGTKRIIAIAVSTRVFLALLRAIDLLGRVQEIRIQEEMLDKATVMLTRASCFV
jgi:hypothetical protein